MSLKRKISSTWTPNTDKSGDHKLEELPLADKRLHSLKKKKKMKEKNLHLFTCHTRKIARCCRANILAKNLCKSCGCTRQICLALSLLCRVRTEKSIIVHNNTHMLFIVLMIIAC